MNPFQTTVMLRPRHGFTLIELLLVVVLIMLLVGAMVFNFSGLLRGNQLQEGTTRLETLMRFARAQAANSGRKVQLVFSAEATNAPAATTGEVRATWEQDPLKQPGSFSDLGDAQWHLQEINDLVQVESVKLFDASAACPSVNAAEDDATGDGAEPIATPMPPITFYPDGSSDSAEIIVAARDPEEEQRMAVRLVGITGSITHQLVSTDLEELIPEPLLLDRPVSGRRDTAFRDIATDREPTPRYSSPRSTANSSKVASSSMRATVGETNSVDGSQ